MLVLTRRVGEDVVLPGVPVRITLLSVAGGRIRLGVEAPRAVQVLRGEVAGDGEGGRGPAPEAQDVSAPSAESGKRRAAG